VERYCARYCRATASVHEMQKLWQGGVGACAEWDACLAQLFAYRVRGHMGRRRPAYDRYDPPPPPPQPLTQQQRTALQRALRALLLHEQAADAL
jgi:hypothetical protein